MEVKEVKGEEALVEQGGITIRVRTDLLDEIHVGDYVLVHAGFALQRIDPEEAQQTLALFQEMIHAPGG